MCLLIWWLFYRMLVNESGTALLWGGTIFLLLFWFFIVAFFREPRRVRIHDNDLVFAPCDGRVVVTEVVRMPSGQRALFRQIAGLIARRIVSYMKVGHQVEQNSVCGFIKFGSRIDVLVPKDSELLVEIGDPTIGSQTPIARLRKVEE